METHAQSRYDLFAPDALADPYSTYQRMRADGPVHWSAALGGWVLLRQQDVLAALRDPRLSTARLGLMLQMLSTDERAQLQPLAHAWDRWLSFVDQADHARMRPLISAAFTPRIVAGMQPRIQRLVDELIDGFVERGRCDLIADLAYPLPATVITEMLGGRPQDRDQLKAWSDEIALIGREREGLPILLRIQQGVLGMTGYFREIAAKRRAQPQDDLMSNLLQAEQAGHALSIDEVLATCTLLLFAGHATTTQLIANGLLCLLKHPEQLQQLKDNPALITSAVEEMLRYGGPALLLVRTASADLELGGQQIAAGQGVYPAVAAANRDPAVFADPERFDITRGDNRHLSFGYGTHFCVGSALARLETRIAIETLLRRLPNLRLATDQLQWTATPIFRGLLALPLAFDTPSS
jgi:hypothetical protein